MTAREAAKDLIRYSVLRGEKIEAIWYGRQGCFCSHYGAMVGGYINQVSVGKYKIIVFTVGGQEVNQVFSLKEIYDEILHEKEYGKQEQLALF